MADHVTKLFKYSRALTNWVFLSSYQFCDKKINTVIPRNFFATYSGLSLIFKLLYEKIKSTKKKNLFCDVKRTKINEKEDGIGPYLKKSV